LKWNPDAADNCNTSNNLGSTDASVDTVADGRYSAALKVDQEIDSIAQTIESLDFVKTYASRAYETDYPNTAFEATQEDVLAHYPGLPLSDRYVTQIQAFDTTTGLADEHPYVQVSRLRNPQIPLYDLSIEDYWFLIVNRRALPSETRQVRLVLETDPAHRGDPYYYYRILQDTLIAEPCRNDTCNIHYVEVVLAPGEGELVHFFRGEFGCDSTHYHIQNLTAIRSDSNIKLRWEAVTQTDSGEIFEVDNYFIFAARSYEGPYAALGHTTGTTYTDSLFAVQPRSYYQVQACGTVIREGQRP
jgi:hypothetical protein